MKTSTLLVRLALVVTAALPLLLPQDATAQLKVRVSVKLLYDNTVFPPIPPGGDVDGDNSTDTNHCGSLFRSAISCDQEILEKWDYVNRVMTHLGRGYIFDPIEIVHLTNPPAPPLALGANAWTLAPPDGDTEQLLTQAAIANPSSYAYRPDAINYYVFDANGGGYADNTVATATNEILTTSQSMYGSWPRFLHEIGHFLGLFHTFGRGSGTNYVTTDDVCDTLNDRASFQTLDDIAQLNFSVNFTNLTCAQQEKVYDVYYNIMSYHADDNHTNDARFFDFASVQCNTNALPDTSQHIRHRLTTDQLDRISNRLNNLATVGVTSGRTVFVSPSSLPCDQAPRSLGGGVTPPEPSIAAGLASAAADPNEDIVLIRAGTYVEALTINQPVTLRATRGDVIIAP